MYQSSQYDNSRAYGDRADSSSSHHIDMVFLAILFVGFFSCIIRSDYNFAIIFFCYFIWQQRKDSLALKIILASIVILIIFDILFALTEVRVWVKEDPNNEIWQTIMPMHYFGIFCFALINILKLILLAFVVKTLLGLKKAVQPH